MHFMPSILTGELEAPSTQATERVPSSWLEGNHPAEIRSCSRTLPEVSRILLLSDFAAFEVLFTPSETTAARNVTIHQSPHFAPENWPVGVVEQERREISVV